MIYPIAPISNPQYEPYVWWEGFFSLEEINAILTLPNWNKTANALIGGRSNPISNADIRSTNISWLENTADTKWIYERIATVLATVNSTYFKFDLSGMHELIQLGVYDANQNGHYNWHIDAGKDSGVAPRKLSFAMLLSDPSDFEGGNLELKINNDEPVKVEQAQGRAWLFPSYTLHRVTPVTKGTRKSLVVWAGGPTFK